MGLVFYVSAIKINADGLCASQTQCVLRHHVNMKINEKPTNSYVNATKNEMGA